MTSLSTNENTDRNHLPKVEVSTEHDKIGEINRKEIIQDIEEEVVCY